MHAATALPSGGRPPRCACRRPSDPAPPLHHRPAYHTSTSHLPAQPATRHAAQHAAAADSLAAARRTGVALQWQEVDYYDAIVPSQRHPTSTPHTHTWRTGAAAAGRRAPRLIARSAARASLRGGGARWLRLPPSGAKKVLLCVPLSGWWVALWPRLRPCPDNSSRRRPRICRVLATAPLTHAGGGAQRLPSDMLPSSGGSINSLLNAGAHGWLLCCCGAHSAGERQRPPCHGIGKGGQRCLLHGRRGAACLDFFVAAE